MTVTLPDALAALCAYLAAQPTLANLLDRIPAGTPRPLIAGSPAIFRPDLPQAADKLMPLGSIVVRPGGYREMGEQTFYLGDPRMDIICFGATQMQATGIAQAAVVVLKQLTFPQIWERCQLYSARVDTGPVPLPDQQTLWPACWLSATVLHGELPASE